MQSKWLLAGLAIGIALVVGGCPTPPAANGNANVAPNANGNLNGTANENANENLNGGNENLNGGNENLNANENAGNENAGNVNANSGANENANAGQNANTNAGANTNANSGGNTNDNANNNSSNVNANGGNQNANSGNSLELQAVSEVTYGLASFGAVMNAFGAVSDPLVNFDALGNAGDLTNSSDPNPCPAGFWVGSSGVVTFELDFGAGCSVPETNGETISGKILMTYTRSTNTGVVSFQNFVVNGRAITGGMTLVITGGGLTGQIAFSGSANVSSGGDRTVSGNVSGTITVARVITLNATDASIVIGSSTRTVDLAGVQIDGNSEPNFAPRAGSATIDGAGLTSSTVTFAADTPDTGVVSVSVGGGAASSFDIPGIGS